jgi:hypothetical protein
VAKYPPQQAQCEFYLFIVVAEHAEPKPHRYTQNRAKRAQKDKAQTELAGAGLFSILHLKPSPTRQYTLLIRPQQPRFVFALYIYIQKAILKILNAKNQVLFEIFNCQKSIKIEE